MSVIPRTSTATTKKIGSSGDGRRLLDIDSAALSAGEGFTF
jgi:hypothetical protein